MNARCVRLCVVTLGLLAPGLAHAGNGLHPRTPVLWEDVPCMTLHDRSQSAVMHLPYGIPFEDTRVTVDEVPDSRTHQFFAMCRSRHPQDFLPVWITQADVDEAIEYELITPGSVETENILELNDDWDGCWFRINADDARRAITQANADAGVDWDTTDLLVGGYNLYGYTHEPVFNLWWPRAGVVKLHDGDPGAVGPVGAISTGELTPYRDQTIMLDGCVDTLDGTSFTVSYALTAESPEWIEYAADLEIDGATFSFEFTPPVPLHGQAGLLRVDFTDPMDRTYTAFHTDGILVIDSDNPEDCSEGGGFIGEPCNESGGPDESSGGAAGTGTSSGTMGSTTGSNADSTGTPQSAGAGPDPKGCGCGSAPAHGYWAALVVLGFRRRRGSTLTRG